MNLTKLFVGEVFEELKKVYSIYYGELPNITLTYIPKQQLVDDSKSTESARWVIDRLGEEEYAKYPSFAAVYFKDKDPNVYKQTETYYISFCFEFAKELLDPIEGEPKVKCYLMHILAHEITHILEDKFIERAPNLWSVILEDTVSREMASEKLAELVANVMGGDGCYYMDVHHLLWDEYLNKLVEAGSK
jgi:hypothetical protein